MCDHWDTLPVRVKISADLSSTGREKWKDVQIDRCMAPLVDKLQKGGVDMLASCCCHGGPLGVIDLQDGRKLLVDHKGELENHGTRLFLKTAWAHFSHPKKIRIKVAWDNFTWRIKNLKWRTK